MTPHDRFQAAPFVAAIGALAVEVEDLRQRDAGFALDLAIDRPFVAPQRVSLVSVSQSVASWRRRKVIVSTVVSSTSARKP